MAITPVCDICNTILMDYGAILLSPPDKKSQVIKYHICKDCFKDILKTKNISIKNKYKK